MKPIVLDNGNLRLIFNPGNGALCGLDALQHQFIAPCLPSGAGRAAVCNIWI